MAAFKPCHGRLQTPKSDSLAQYNDNSDDDNTISVYILKEQIKKNKTKTKTPLYQLIHAPGTSLHASTLIVNRSYKITTATIRRKSQFQQINLNKKRRKK